MNFDNIETSEFSRPLKMVALALIGLPLTVVGYAIFVIWANPVIAGTLGIYSGAGLDLLVGGEVIFVAGAVLAIIGAFGAIQGIWRIGERYKSLPLKLGSMILIVPYLDAIAVTLLLIGAFGTRRRLSHEPR